MLSALSYAWQSWTRAKGVAALAALALAVGIGSSTAIYTVVNAVMLQPLPYPEGDRFVALYGTTTTAPESRSSHRFPHLIEYQQRTRSFDVFGWFTPRNFNLTAPGPPRHVNGVAVTPSLAHHLGVNPAIGTWFRDDSGAVISHGLWTALGADAGIVGKPVMLDGRGYTITGVMPPRFRLPVAGPGGGRIESDVWIFLDPLGRGQNPGEGLFFSYARRKPGVTLAQAEADVKRVAAEIAKRDTGFHPSYSARLDDLRGDTIESIRPTLLVLFAAAGLLLLITCANVAGLLLARSVARARETAVRVALGAGQRALALQYFFEGLLVSLVGAVAGVAASVGMVRLVVSIATDYIPHAEGITVDWRVIAFAFGMVLLTSALCGLAPLWQAMRTSPTDVLRDGVRASAGVRSRRLSRSLVVAEVALAFTLLAAGAILMAHLGRLTRVWPGFDADNLLVFQLKVSDPSGTVAAFDGSPARAAHHQRLIDTLAALPGVGDAALVNQLPLDGCCIGTNVYPEGRSPDLSTAQKTSLLAVSPGYLRTMKIPLRSGRYLTAQDTNDDLLPVVINETAARVYWPGQSPVGAFARLGGPTGTRFQVVGVVGDIRNDTLGKPTVPEISLSSAVLPVNPMWFLVRSPLPPATVVQEVRQAVQRIDPTQPIQGVATMREIARESVALERVGSLMIGFFAAAALLMATLGVYGVIAYSVRQGRVEIGTRMALGAMSRDVLWLFVGSGLKMALGGIVIGGLAVTATASLLTRLFSIHDPGWMPFVAALAIVTAIVAAASFFPAWRASRLSPMVAIRNQSAAS